MAYCAIATVMHDATHPITALETAISFARKNDVHLHVLCVGVDHTAPGFYSAGASTVAVQQNFEVARKEAAATEAVARKRLDAEDIKWDVRTITVMPGGLMSVMSDTMRFFDLMFLRGPYQAKGDDIDRQIFETCMFNARAPVVIVPDDASTECDFDRILLGWDDGQQALASVRAALPLIQNASVTEIVIVDPPAHGPDRSDPGGRLAAYLARSGATADIAILARTQPTIAEQLLQYANDQQSDLIVMGAYGHSPLREAVLGGATRDMLRKAKLPILMAH